MKTRYGWIILTLLLWSGVFSVQAQDNRLTIWTPFNHNSPQNSQDRWMAAMMQSYQAETGITLDNITRPYDTLNTDLNLALLAGGDVPDVSYLDSNEIGAFALNGTLLDLRPYVENERWFRDLDADSLAACTTATGELLCIPTIKRGTLTYYWTSAFPDGFDGALESLDAATTRYGLTGKQAEGLGFNVFWYPLLASYGVQFADEQGRATWASAEAVEAITMMQQLHAEGRIPSTALGTGFDYENPFKDGSAGAFVAGSWSYVFLRPLTAPAGTEFSGEADSAVAQALASGELALTAPIHTRSGEPVSYISVNAWAIPLTSRNIEGALAFINWQMTTDRNAAYAEAYGGEPTLRAALETATFQTPYWQAVSAIIDQYGTPMPRFYDYNLARRMFVDTVVGLIQDPSQDILYALQSAQADYNAEVEAAQALNAG
jgi:ABC-type glycerol-3-phosphate transport system substrate-binding protein